MWVCGPGCHIYLGMCLCTYIFPAVCVRACARVCKGPGGGHGRVCLVGQGLFRDLATKQVAAGWGLGAHSVCCVL